MNRHKIQRDRYKIKEVFKSESTKRKIGKEKEIKNGEVLAKSRRVTDYITKSTPNSSDASIKNNNNTCSVAYASQSRSIDDSNMVSILKIIKSSKKYYAGVEAADPRGEIKNSKISLQFIIMQVFISFTNFSDSKCCNRSS